MNSNQSEKQKNFTSSLITALAMFENVPTRDDVAQKAQALALVWNYDGNLEIIIDAAMRAVVTRMGSGVSLINVESMHDENWVHKRDDLPTVYSDAYEGHLKEQGWYPVMVESLSGVCTRILGHLQDPKSEGDSWDRRGLVIGSVQSGKTANYLGLIAKAADAGYKFIIVIAGIHNILRKQTQERIDEGFVGLSSALESRNAIGVGRDADYPNPITLTNINDDFTKKTAEASGWKLNDFSKPIIFVIKKNVNTLNALYKWLKEMNAQGNDRIADVPMLTIDDEADNASVNTNKADLDPTKTNAMIRKILGLFEKSCYVGYTATPFANIFINPESYDDEVRDELFPRDFIYCLDAPNTYFGPDKVFLDEISAATITKPIVDCEDYLPFSHKKDFRIKDLPPSLYHAIDCFIVARAIRNLSGHENSHCSMMVNVSRFVDIQKDVRNIIGIYEKNLRNAVKANYAMPEEVSSRNRQMASLKRAYEQEFANDKHDWSAVKSALHGVFENLRIYVVNSRTDEVLDYKKYENDHRGLTAIAVGGLSLSRGLTIEGLCVSYMYRNTKTYDTLMQMGRWFGYREGYADLCRVYLSQDSIDWYSHIAEASEELKQQITRMRRHELSPRKFGLYVRAHPDRLLITARNKMRSGEKMTFSQNFSGKLRESSLLPDGKELNDKNESLIAEYWKDGFGGHTVGRTSKGWFIENCETELVEEFLTRFKTHDDYTAQKIAFVEFLQKISHEHLKSDVLLISIKENGEDKGQYRLGTQTRRSKFEDGAWHTSGYRVASRGDEKLGLSDAQIQQAVKDADDRGAKAASDIHYRIQRKKPLLMLHSLNLFEGSKEGGQVKEIKRVPAFGISFPDGHYETEVQVVANPVLLERMSRTPADDPDDEEDYDD